MLCEDLINIINVSIITKVAFLFDFLLLFKGSILFYNYASFE